MKFNVTYSPQTNLLETLKDVEIIKTKLINKLFSIRKFIKVSAPLFLEENDPIIVDMSSKTRPITFDFGDEYKVGTMLLTHTNWLRKLINRTKIGKNEGLYIDASYIWRDDEEDPSSTPARDEITFQYIVSDEGAIEEAKKIVQDVYEHMYELNAEFTEKYKGRNSWPEFANYISAQSMVNEMPSETFKQREMDTILENVAFIFESPGYKLHSGKTHSIISPTLYDLKNFYQIVLKDSVNSNILKVASVAILASGQTLTDQLYLNDLSNLLTNDFYANLSKQKDKIIEIKINIPRLAMALLHKGHIGEVQPGVISDDSYIIKERNKIEII